jgi:uncharacterized short protein YbdD (DUF466 family)
MNLKQIILEEIKAFEEKPNFEELYNKIQSIKNDIQYDTFIEKKFPEAYNGEVDYPEWFYTDFKKYIIERKKEEVLEFIKKSHLLIKLYGYEYNYEEKFGEYYDEFVSQYGIEIFLGSYDDKNQGRIERKIKKKRGVSAYDALIKADKSGVDHELLNKLNDYNYKQRENQGYPHNYYFSFIHTSKQKILNAVENQINEEEGYQGIYRDPEKNIITLPAPNSKKNEITNIRQGEHQIDVLKAKYDSMVNPLKQKYPNMKVLDFDEFTKQESIPNFIEIPQWYYNSYHIPEWFKTYIEHIKTTNPDGTFERFLLDNENNFGKVIGNYQLFANKIKREYWRIKGRVEQGIDVLTRTIKDEMRLGSFDPKTYTSILALKDKGENQGSDIVTNLIKSASNYISHKHQLAASDQEEPEDEDEGAPEYDDTKQDYYATLNYFGQRDSEEAWEDYLDWRSDGYSNKKRKNQFFKISPYEKWWFKKYGPAEGRYYDKNRHVSQEEINNRFNSTMHKHKNNPDFRDAWDQAERNDEDFDWQYWENQEPKDNFTGTDEDARQRVEKDNVKNSISTIDKFLQAARVSKVDPEVIRNLEKLLSNSNIETPTPELKKSIKKLYRLIAIQLHPDKQLTPEQKKKSEEAFKSFTNDIYDKLPSQLKESLSFKEYFKLIL